MPATLTYPGVYVEEISSGVHTITAVATSITAFIGRALRGPTDADEASPVIVNGFADFERIFGGLWEDSSLGFAVRDFFLNGGAQAAIVRLVGSKDASGAALDPAKMYRQIVLDGLTLESASAGKWATALRVSLDADVSPAAAKALGFTKAAATAGDPPVGDPSNLFNLTVTDTSTGRTERLLNLTLLDKNTANKATNRRIDLALARESQLLRWSGAYSKPATALTELARLAPLQKTLTDAQKAYLDKVKSDPTNTAALKTLKDGIGTAQTAYDTQRKKDQDDLTNLESDVQAAKGTGDFSAVTKAQALLSTGLDAADAAIHDETVLGADDFVGSGKESGKTGLYALERADLFNILCIPPYKASADGTPNVDTDPQLIAEAAAYCEKRRAFFIIDPPAVWTDKASAVAGIKNFTTNSKNAAVFFPRLRQPNPFHDGAIGEFAPCGAMAGLFARTDTNRGVWKAPAGLETSLVAVPELSVKLTDGEHGELNPLGVNCLRAFPSAGRVSWGARTLQGADSLSSEWKYIPVRRTALFLEESLYRGTQWVVFEPNDAPLWAQIRLNVGAFMHNLFRQGAFQGQTPSEAYLVKCDKETTTQNDIDLGIVNIVVGFAPLKPAEFVVLKLQQLAGQIEV